MAITGYPFVSVDGDRKYGPADIAAITDTQNAGSNGVIQDYLNELAVTSLGAYQTQIATGGACFGGYTFQSNSNITLTHDTVAPGSKRYDIVVFTLDSSVARAFAAGIVKGTASAGTPTVPSIGAFDTALARIYIDNTTGTPAYTVLDLRSYKAVSGSNTSILEKVKEVDGAGSALDADLLDGQHGSYYLPVSSYTAADVLTKIKTVDGSGSGLDADTVDGASFDMFNTAIVPEAGKDQNLSTLYAKGSGRQGFAVYVNSSYTPGTFTEALRVDFDGAGRLGGNTIWTSGNDGAGSGLDADRLDGQDSSYFLPAASYTASDVLTKIKTVDGSGSGLDADLLRGVTIGNTGTGYLPAVDGNGDILVGTASALVRGLNIANAGAISGWVAALMNAGKSVGVLLGHEGIAKIGTVSNANLAVNPSGGNLLVGKLTDNSLGKLQVEGSITASQGFLGPGAFRLFDGGAVSGTVTLPAINVNETLVSWYSVSTTTTFNMPAGGTYNAIGTRSTVVSSVVVPISGGATILIGDTDVCIIYSRIS